MSGTVRKAVIPAAGRGTRMLPATRRIPKELLPVAGKPLIQYAIEEAAASGIEEVILVLAKGKEAVAEHFAISPHSVEPQFGAAKPATPAIRVAWQDSPRGLADAIVCARSWIDDEPFAVILPDVLIDSETPCTAQLMNCYSRSPGCIIAARRVTAEAMSSFGILDLALHEAKPARRTLRINSLVERPSHTAISPYGIFGRYILLPSIFASIERTLPGFAGELQLADSLQLLVQRVPMFGFLFEGDPYDAGSHLGLLEASIAFALKSGEIGAPLRECIRQLLLRSNSSTPSSVSELRSRVPNEPGIEKRIL
jgi:UTP--glucose-1-phosphate uridylyltransferase